MLYLEWLFLWLVAGERIQGFNTSDCFTKKLLWTYSERSEEFVLFCDLSEPEKSHFYNRNQHSPTQGPEHLPCSGSKDLSDVQWYLQPQNGDPLREITKNYSHIILDQNTLHFLTVEMNNAGSYICRPRIRMEDYSLKKGVTECNWVKSMTFTRALKDTRVKPDILEPIVDTLEVELGKPLTLNCTARFGFQKDFKPVLRWYSKDSNQQLEILTSEGKSVQSTFEDEIIQRVVHLKEVTQRDLRKMFICFAQNSIGNTTQSIQLKEKKGVVFLYILLGTVTALAGMLMAGALLYMYWIEIVLLYRTYQRKDETLGDKKEFDAFISYAKWSSFESEAGSSLSEETLALNLFPDVLENKYGYTLFLLERDMAPGGVYAEDIVNIIKKSRRGIFILSPNYVNGPSVFELQAAVNLALNDQTLKLILIKFCPFQEPESLPHLVKRALRVLPTITWRGLKSMPSNSRFWTQMRYHMPVKNSKGFT
ncbi:interleukin-18 receptor accessory protein isoform X2 [Rhinolophus sinicus]|uniref:interleukin-18 receptor accessory protein isoform X2 n=1 Tax=Rhinolophus sinicus TaxID=89399 RepID=UPI003D7B067C